MKISLVKGENLTSDIINVWGKIQIKNKNYFSPFLTPEYIHTVSMVRPDIFVAILEENNKIIGFFPFQKNNDLIGEPVGKSICDYQAILIEDHIQWEIENLIVKCGIKSWEFDHLVQNHSKLEKYYLVKTVSPIIEIPKKFELYIQRKSTQKSKIIARIKYMIRKFEKEVGLIRFEFNENREQILNQLIRWKSIQHKRTNVFDLFSVDWIIELVKRIHHTKTDQFCGILSTIFFDDLPIAIHMGMKYKNVLHYWFPAYNVEYSGFSPGLILLLKILEYAYSEGITIIDLGKGLYPYKQRFMTGTIPIAEGFVSLN